MVFPGALGDFLLALPALRFLRAQHAAACATLVVPEPLRALARVAFDATEVASLDAAEAAGLFGGGALPSWLADRPVVYSWLGARDETVRARLRAAAASARFFGVERGPGAAHAAVAYAQAVGAPCARSALARAARLAPPPSSRAATVLAGLRGPVLALHAGAGSPAKRWSCDRFVAVAGWWRRRGGDVVEVVGPAESGARAVADGGVADCWPLPDLAALLARVDAFVGNDSGVSHLAGAAGARGAVVFGPTDPARWRPCARTLAAVRASDDAASVTRVERALARVLQCSSLTTQNPQSSVRA